MNMVTEVDKVSVMQPCGVWLDTRGARGWWVCKPRLDNTYSFPGVL